LAPVTDRPREMRIPSQPHEASEVLVAVQDSGHRIDSANKSPPCATVIER